MALYVGKYVQGTFVQPLRIQRGEKTDKIFVQYLAGVVCREVLEPLSQRCPPGEAGGGT